MVEGFSLVAILRSHGKTSTRGHLPAEPDINGASHQSNNNLLNRGYYPRQQTIANRTLQYARHITYLST